MVVALTGVLTAQERTRKGVEVRARGMTPQSRGTKCRWRWLPRRPSTSHQDYYYPDPRAAHLQELPGLRSRRGA